ncbi:hypothetical protein [Intrasporangium sp. YIM S08009]|uniref:hypothetical protein n=1 Tax=Intrasporangium zincisolvens TaxID=3080018 RepID=UPI002B05DC20|nr:hypothetical protein [Intrasporangium sp. YIM S08009]
MRTSTTRTRTTRIAGASLAAAAAMALSVGPAFAADGWVSANLRPVPGSEVSGSGTAQVTVTGNTIKVEMAASGLLPDQPHAAHIHFAAAARHECPSIKDDTNGDGTINTTEGGPAYGDIVVSLTKTGDTSPKSGLAVDRFSTAPGGNISYERGSIKVSDGVAEAITKGQSVVVIHGVDHNHDGKYSGKTKSDLDPKLPTEATDPALCGALHVAPAGGMHTGGGLSSTTNTNGMLLAVGGVALLAAAGSGAFATRRTTRRTAHRAAGSRG